MKILVLVNRFPWPLKDGGALGYFNNIKGLHDLGHELTVAVLNTSKHHVQFEKLPEEVKSLATFHLFDIDNRIKPLDALLNLCFSNESYHVTRFYQPGFERMLENLLDHTQFDLVFFETIFVAPYLPLVRTKTKAKIVLRQHNVEYQIWETVAAAEPNPIKKRYLQILSARLKKFEQAQLNRFDAVTALTQSDAKVFEALGITKPLFVSGSGIDTSRFESSAELVEENSLFHLGSMDWMPNQQAMIWFLETVWPTLHERHPQLHFYLAGRNMPATFQRFACDNVHIVGEVTDALAFMKSKQIQVVPLFSGSGIRLKILEGLALGKCIVSTSLGATGIEVVDGKQLFIANEAKTFCEVITDLIGHPQKIKEAGIEARKLILEHYENKVIQQNVIQFCEALGSTRN